MSFRSDRLVRYAVYYITFITVTLLMTGATLSRNLIWQNEVGAWEDAAAKSPLKGRSYYGLGCAYAKSGRFADAVAMFDRAIALDPHYYAAYQKRGNAYDDLYMPGRAFEDYDRVIRMAPAFAEVYYDRGLAYERQGRFSEARSDLGRGCELGDSLSCTALGKLPVR